MSKLGEALCCHKSNITQLVDLLTEKNMIERCSSGEDRRVQCVKLTSEGKKLMEKIHRALEKNAHGCLEALENSEQQQLVKLLTKYADKNGDA